MEGTIGEIRAFGGNFAPMSWAFCKGQLMPIAQYTPLYAIIGNIYGGDGQTTFGLPDLQGRTGIGTGQGPGLQNYDLGQVGGTESITFLSSNMPAHNHTATATSTSTLQADNTAASTGNPNNKVLAQNASTSLYVIPDASLVTMAPQAVQTATTVSIGIAGGSQPYDNRVPYLAVNFIICLEGIFPSRN